MNKEVIELCISLSEDIDANKLFTPFIKDKISGLQISIDKAEKYVILYFKLFDLREIEKLIDILDIILEIASRHYRKKEKNLRDL